MLSRWSRALLGGGFALGIGVLAALPGVSPAAAGTGLRIVNAHHVLLNVHVHSNVTRAEAARAATASSTFTQFKSTVKVGTKSYTYVLAGKNPAKKVANASSTIKSELVPVIVKVVTSSGTLVWDSTTTSSCDTGASPLSRVQKSPIVVSRPSWKFGGTSIGKGQVTDAYQRADFWKYAKPTGINPSYGVNLAWTTLKPVTITVPVADAAGIPISCGNGFVADIAINWLLPHLQKTVIPSLASKGLVSNSNLPVFLVSNVVEYEGTNPNNCCVLGYHNAFNRAGGVQTYGYSDYDNSAAFVGSSDISALSHEVAEWQNDPYGNNPTPSWGHIGQVTGCQNNLEVGDPLSGTTFAVNSGTFTYHPQELAFFSWFYHQKPSLGVNGWYSDQGKFKTFAKACA